MFNLPNILKDVNSGVAAAISAPIVAYVVFDHFSKHVVDNYLYVHSYKFITFLFIPSIIILFYKLIIETQPMLAGKLYRLSSLLFIGLYFYILLILILYIIKHPITFDCIRWHPYGSTILFVTVYVILWVLAASVLINSDKRENICELMRTVLIIYSSYLIVMFASTGPLFVVPCLSLPGGVVVDMKATYYKDDISIHVPLIKAKGPDTGLSIKLFKEESTNLRLIDFIELEPQRNFEIRYNNSILCGNAMGNGEYEVHINTTSLYMGYYRLTCELPQYEEKIYEDRNFRLLNNSQQS